MKTTGTAVKTAMALMSALMAVTQADAQLTWGPGGAGGTGTWDAGTANWYNGSSDVVWDSGTAVFQGTAGIVTVDGTQSAAGLTFNSSFYTLSGGTIALTGGAISGTGIGITIASSLSGSNGLLFTGGVSRTISGDNTGLTGLIDVAEGFVRVGSNNALGSSSADEDRVQLQSGTILQLSGDVALPKAITTTNGATTIQAIGNSSVSGALSFGATTVLQMDTGAQLTLTGAAGLGSTGSSVQTTGAGRLILDAAGAGSVEYGFFVRGTDMTVQANAVANPFGTAGANIFLDANPGNHTLALNGATIGNNLWIEANGSSRKVENMAAGTSTYSGQLLLGAFAANTTTVLRSTTASGTLEISGHLRDDNTTANLEIGNATYENSGTVLFSRASGNLYDGSTTIHSGLLAVSNTSGSATGSGVVTVDSGGALGGTGIIEGSVSVSGTVAPGIAGIGTLSVNNDVTWNGGQSWVFELGSAGPSLGAPGASDLLAIVGIGSDFLQGTGSAWTFDFADTGGLGWYKLVEWAGNSDFESIDFTGSNLGEGLVSEFTIQDNVLYVNVVPEPSTYALILGAAALLFFKAYRRRA